MEQIQSQVPSFEGVWAILQETSKMQKESSADFDRRMKESEQAREKSRADFDHGMKRLEELAGSWANNHGSFAEEYSYLF